MIRPHAVRVPFSGDTSNLRFASSPTSFRPQVQSPPSPQPAVTNSVTLRSPRRRNFFLTSVFMLIGRTCSVSVENRDAPGSSPRHERAERHHHHVQGNEPRGSTAVEEGARTVSDSSGGPGCLRRQLMLNGACVHPAGLYTLPDSAGCQLARTREKSTRTTAIGAATKLKSAPIFVSASAAPAGKAAVAKKSETVNPIAATTPTTNRSLSVGGPDGR